MALFKKDNIDYIDVARKRLLLAWENLDNKLKQNIIKNNLIAEFEKR